MPAPVNYITTTSNLNALYKTIRRNDRINANIRVVLEIPSKQKKLFAQTSDISLGGMACYISDILEIKEELNISMQIQHSKETMKITAMVRNRNSFRYGLEFTSISAEDQIRLQKYLSTLNCMA